MTYRENASSSRSAHRHPVARAAVAALGMGMLLAVMSGCALPMVPVLPLLAPAGVTAGCNVPLGSGTVTTTLPSKQNVNVLGLLGIALPVPSDRMFRND